MRRRRPSLGTFVYGLGLVAAWVLLWGAWSAANVLSGIAVAAALILLLVPAERRSAEIVEVRPLALARLGVYLLRQLATSNVMLIREVLAREGRRKTAVVAVPLTGASDQVVTTLANFMAMAPGTMPVEVEEDPTVLYVHVLHLDDLEAARRQLYRLRDLTVRALGSEAAVACLEERP
jgi:multicomponent Na+:H+ antiporter subunit E